MNTSRNITLVVMAAVRTLVTALSSFSLIFAGHQTQAAQPPASNRQSPLLVLSQGGQASIARLVADIKQAGAGSVTPANIHAAIAEAVAANPGADVDMLAAAINRLELNDESLAAAIMGSAHIFDREVADVLSALITDSYMTYGRDAAQALIARLRIVAGNKAVEDALEDLPISEFQTIEELRNIQPASGLYDG